MKRPLQVTLHAHEPSVIELTVAERVQLDRIMPSQHGIVAERHGPLLGPGVTTVALEQGRYFFKTLSAASLRIVHGGVDTGIHAYDKDGPPPFPPAKGDEVPGELPGFTIEHA